MDRRSFMSASAAGMLGGRLSSRPSRPTADGLTATLESGGVNLVSDGLELTPRELGGLLSALAREPGIGVDSYCRGGVVEQVERAFAEELGKERAIYLPSGTLANHVGVRALARLRPWTRRVLVQADSHFYCDEGDCAQNLSGLNLVPIAPGRANVTAEDVEAAIARASTGRVRIDVGVISIESPVRRHFNECVDFEELGRIAELARARGIGIHLDGARLPVAEAFGGIPQHRWAALADTVFVSLYKCYNAPSGAILAGSAEVIDGLHHERRMFGGSLRHAWPLAAVGLAYHPGFQERFARIVAAAEELFASLRADGRFEVAGVPRGSNVRRVRLRNGDVDAWRQRVARAGIVVPKPGDDGWMSFKTNESLGRRPIGEIVAELCGS